MARASLADEQAAVRSLCGTLRLGAVDPLLIRAGHHSSFRLAALPILARVQSSEPLAFAWNRAARELAVAGYLAARASPTPPPLPAHLAGPHRAGPAIVTLWPFLDELAPVDEDDVGVAARALAALHRALAGYDGPLPPYTRALDRCRAVVRRAPALARLPLPDRRLLERQFDRLCRETGNAAARWTALHGDAHLGNLLLGPGGPLWLDLEDACCGPAEVDIACLPEAAWPLFRHADQGLVRRFADLRSVCVAIWCWAEVDRSAAMREAAEYHLDRVRALPG